MDVVVIGMGEVGKHIASVLVAENHNVTLIDRSESALAHAQESMDVMTLCGDGGSLSTLTQAKADAADLVIAVTDNDEINLLACLMAKKLGAGRVVARVSDTNDPLTTDSTLATSLGIDMVISPERAAAVELARIIEAAGVLWVETFSDERIVMVRVRVTDAATPSVGKTLHELVTPANTLIAAIGRAGRFIIPDGRERIAVDDELYLIGRTDVIDEAREALVGPRHPANKVVIIGASAIGRALSNELTELGIDSFIVERDGQVAEQAAMQLAGANVIHGDGTQSEFLRSADLGNADVFVVVTRSDEVNLMAGLLAKKMGIPAVIALTHKPDYAPIYEELGIDTTISPRLLAANQVLRYVRKGRVVAVSVLANGQGEVLELQTIHGARICGRPLKEVGFPSGARIGAVVTEDDVVIPSGDYIVPEQAHVIVFTTPDRREEVEQLFRKKSLSLF
jgi:trk system potassium uptake protein TrkA